MRQDGGADVHSRSAEKLWRAFQGRAGRLPDRSRAQCPARGKSRAHRRPAPLALQRKTHSQRRRETQACRTAGLIGAEQNQTNVQSEEFQDDECTGLLTRPCRSCLPSLFFLFFLKYMQFYFFVPLNPKIKNLEFSSACFSSPFLSQVFFFFTTYEVIFDLLNRNLSLKV